MRAGHEGRRRHPPPGGRIRFDETGRLKDAPLVVIQWQEWRPGRRLSDLDRCCEADLAEALRPSEARASALLAPIRSPNSEHHTVHFPLPSAARHAVG